MSRKTRKRRRGFPWPVLVFGGVVLIAAALMLGTRKGNSAAGSDNGSGSGKVAVEPAKIDYGYVKFGNNETFKIKVTNTGAGTLRFTDKPYIEVLEGC